MAHRIGDTEGSTEIDQRSVTYKVVFVLLIAAVIGLIGVVYASINSRASSTEDRFEKKIASMEVRIDKKVEQEQYDRQMDKFEGYMKEIRNMFHDHEEKSRKRNE